VIIKELHDEVSRHGYSLCCQIAFNLSRFYQKLCVSQNFMIENFSSHCLPRSHVMEDVGAIVHALLPHFIHL
jgi:hypothetical protein